MKGRVASLTFLVLLAGAVAAGCSDDDDGASPVGLGEQGVGTCLLFEDDVGSQVDELPVVDCAEDHTHEIFDVYDYPSDVYPGFDALQNSARLECLERFRTYVGVDAFESTLFYSWLLPTLDSWNDDDDREVLCVLGRHDGNMMNGSMKETNQ